MTRDLFTTFDRVNVISLQRRPDRLAAIQKRINAVDWPLRSIEVVTAIDGDKCNPPTWYTAGNGAWGCLRSHVCCLEDAINGGINSLLIFEDDAYIISPDSLRDDLQNLINNVPADWDCLFLGGQHFETSESVSAGIVKAKNVQRTHAYAVRGKLIGDLYRFWTDCKTHCDHHLGTFVSAYKSYAADPFLIGQEAGSSDISGRTNPRNTWSKSKLKYPVVAVKGHRDFVESLRRDGFHAGFSLDGNGVDIGLVTAMRSKDTESKVQRILNLIDVLNGECETSNKKAVMIWPASDINAIKLACPGVIELNNPTIESANEAIHG